MKENMGMIVEMFCCVLNFISAGVTSPEGRAVRTIGLSMDFPPVLPGLRSRH